MIVSHPCISFMMQRLLHRFQCWTETFECFPQVSSGLHRYQLQVVFAFVDECNKVFVIVKPTSSGVRPISTDRRRAVISRRFIKSCSLLKCKPLISSKESSTKMEKRKAVIHPSQKAFSCQRFVSVPKQAPFVPKCKGKVPGLLPRENLPDYPDRLDNRFRKLSVAHSNSVNEPQFDNHPTAEHHA